MILLGEPDVYTDLFYSTWVLCASIILSYLNLVAGALRSGSWWRAVNIERFGSTRFFDS